MSTGPEVLLHRCAAICLGALLLPAWASSDAPPSPTHSAVDAVRGVLLITIDTLRADHLGVYGGPVPTPHLDELAAKGRCWNTLFRQPRVRDPLTHRS